jgi:erythromycin esterase
MKITRIIGGLVTLVLTVTSASATGARDAEASGETALRKLARPLVTDKDLDPLLAAMGGARLVLLGEASHGTSEFYTWRDRISRRLIAEKGFAFLVVEGDWASLQALDRYVKGQEDYRSAREVLRKLDRWPQWMWANEEVAALAEWLRAHNQKLPPAKRVGFHGMDVYGWENSLRGVAHHLRELCPDLTEQIESLYAGLARHQGDASSYARAATMGRSHQAEVRKAVELLREHRERLEDVDAAAYFAAKQNAMVVKYAEAHVREMAYPGANSWNTRVRHMELTTVRLKEKYGEDARGIVWAHNTHIGDARATAMAAQQMVNIGQLARERWGDAAVFLLGFATHRGEVLAGRHWGGPRETMRVPPAPAGSVEAALNELDHPEALLVFRGADTPPVLRQVRGHRAIGVIYHPEREAGNYVPTILPQRYDALIFLAETTPLRPLHDP